MISNYDLTSIQHEAIYGYDAHDFENMDTIWNVSKSFKLEEWFKPIDEIAVYRCDE